MEEFYRDLGLAYRGAVLVLPAAAAATCPTK
jgi:hypothetical protein